MSSKQKSTQSSRKTKVSKGSAVGSRGVKLTPVQKILFSK